MHCHKAHSDISYIYFKGKPMKPLALYFSKDESLLYSVLIIAY